MHIDAGSAGYTIRKAYPNARGFIGRIEVTVTADNFAHADAIATRALAPFLSLCVVMLNVPVSVYQTEVTESRTQNRRVTTTLPFFESPPLPTPHGISDEFLIKIGEDFAGHVAAEGHPVFARDAATDARITSDVIRRKRVRALYGCRWREAEKS